MDRSLFPLVGRVAGSRGRLVAGERCRHGPLPLLSPLPLPLLGGAGVGMRGSRGDARSCSKRRRGAPGGRRRGGGRTGAAAASIVTRSGIVRVLRMARCLARELRTSKLEALRRGVLYAGGRQVPTSADLVRDGAVPLVQQCGRAMRGLTVRPCGPGRWPWRWLGAGRAIAATPPVPPLGEVVELKTPRRAARTRTRERGDRLLLGSESTWLTVAATPDARRGTGPCEARCSIWAWGRATRQATFRIRFSGCAQGGSAETAPCTRSWPTAPEPSDDVRRQGRSHRGIKVRGKVDGVEFESLICAKLGRTL